MVLKNTDYNPMPTGAKAGYITTPSGIKLRYAFWRQVPSAPKGTIILLQGRAEYIEKKFETVGDLMKMGFDVLTFDWRGQGGSSRIVKNPRIGYVDDYQDYVEDLTEIVKQVALPDCRGPYNVVAHSTGCLVTLLASPFLSGQIDRMVLCSPFIGIGKQPLSPGHVYLLASFLNTVGLDQVLLTGRNPQKFAKIVEDSIHTSDRTRFERELKFSSEFPELCIQGATAAWVLASCAAIEQVTDPDFYHQIKIPSLMIAAGKDVVVDNRKTEPLARGLRSSRLVVINGARHELLQESDLYREQVFAAIASFLPVQGA